MLDKVAFVMPTHNTKKVQKNKHLAPPATLFIEKTFRSLYDKIIDFDKIEKSIVFNYHGPHDNKYLSNVRDFCLDNNINLHVDQSPGYKGVRCNLPNWIDKEYLFIVEHDWKFLEQINLYRLLHIMDLNPVIKFLRFNKRANIVFPKQIASGRVAGDLFMDEMDFDGVKLCAHPNYTNNPHIERMDALRDKFIPIAQKSNIYQGKNSGAGGFEHPLQEAAFDYLQTPGMTRDDFTLEWGLFSYGPKDGGPYIKHFGV